jgi:hypothetical protein
MSRLLIVLACAVWSWAAVGEDLVRRMPQLLAPDHREEILAEVDKAWQPEYAAMILDLLPLSPDPVWNGRLIRLMEEKTGQQLGYDVEAWYRWLWNRDPRLHALYPDFKGVVYGLVDPRFRNYFSSHRPSSIRLDEVRWGGVQQDGIPPLRSPAMISAAEAGYLEDSHLVFGIALGGEAKAYPRRILGWHEMVVDRIGDHPVTGVYCTLCGTMIVYSSVANGVEHELGTSGFLYRSNKLMVDGDTQSLWSTLEGRPVIGPLVSEGIQLQRLPVVTTTWGEWRRRHPHTLVLDLDTGYERDYSEGAAYRDYFATDQLMFGVPALDQRLKNKDEVLGILLSSDPQTPVAFSHRFLVEHPLHLDQVGSTGVAILTDTSGAHRVYAPGEVKLLSWDGQSRAVDTNGVIWELSEAELQNNEGGSLPRLPVHRAFWFGWYSAFPHTRLVD